MFINYKYMWDKLLNNVKNGEDNINKYDVLSLMSTLEIKQLDYQRNKLREVSDIERCRIN